MGYPVSMLDNGLRTAGPAVAAFLVGLALFAHPAVAQDAQGERPTIRILPPLIDYADSDSLLLQGLAESLREGVVVRLREDSAVAVVEVGGAEADWFVSLGLGMSGQGTPLVQWSLISPHNAEIIAKGLLLTILKEGPEVARRVAVQVSAAVTRRS